MLRAARPEVQLVGDILVAHDGTGDELGEQGDEGAEADEAPLRLAVPAVDVDGVAHGLEGVEADADGQRHVQRRDADAGDAAQRRGKEVVVFEEGQHREVDHHVDNAELRGAAGANPLGKFTPDQTKTKDP